MPIAESLYEKIGAVQFPILAEHLGELQFHSVVKDTLLALFSAAIKTELGWSAGTTVADSPWDIVRANTHFAAVDAVNDTFGLLATREVLLARSSTFPALYLDQIGEAESVDVGDYLQLLRRRWLMTYVLGPLEIGLAKKFRTLCTEIVPAIAMRVIRHKSHPGYNSNLTLFVNGELASLKLLSFSADPLAVSENNPPYWGVSLTIQTDERDDMVEGAIVEYARATFQIGVGGGDGVIPALINLDSAHVPP